MLGDLKNVKHTLEFVKSTGRFKLRKTKAIVYSTLLKNGEHGKKLNGGII